MQYNNKKIAFKLVEAEITNFTVIANSLFNAPESLRKIKQDIILQIRSLLSLDKRFFNFGLLSIARRRVKILQAAMLLQYSIIRRC